jgi:hypothetical protein
VTSFKLKKRCQPFVGTNDKSLSIVAMRVCNPGCSPVGIDACDASPTPSGFAEFVSDDLPVH